MSRIGRGAEEVLGRVDGGKRSRLMTGGEKVGLGAP